MTPARLKERYQELGIGRTELAAILDLNERTLRRYERGYSMPIAVAMAIEALTPETAQQHLEK